MTDNGGVVSAADTAVVAFRELVILDAAGGPNSRPMVQDSTLWTTERIRHAAHGRLHLQALEAILSPTTSSADIMGAVAYGVTSQGLRVTQRDDSGRIVAQRIEAPYLASFATGSRASRIPTVEWRVVVATLGVSRGLAPWGGVERVLLLEFMSDPISTAKQDLASRGAAAMLSLYGAAAAAGVAVVSSSTSNSSSSNGTSSGMMGATTATKSTSAVAIARQRSNQRAEALLEGVAAELNRLGCGVVTAAAAADREEKGLKEAHRDGEKTSSVKLVPWGDGEGTKEGTASSASSGIAAGVERTQVWAAGERCTGTIVVRLCLQFVEGLCARAMEFSRRDASETWRPLDETVRQLERENGQLCQLLEPKYRALGASPPVVPKWTDRRGFGATAAAAAAARSLPTGDATGASPGGVDGSARVTDLLQFSDLFVVEGGWVKARVVPSGIEDGDVIASPVSGAASVSADGETITAEGTDNSSKAVAAAAAAAQCVATRAAVKTLAGVVGSVCEARQEALLKECMPGAQKYVAELEAYRSAIVGGSALRAAAGAGIGKARGARGARGAPINGSDRSSAEIDDDLWRLFGAMETRLYSSPAALGKKPGRIYLTYNTLWFYSKVMTFESRHVLPLSEVKSVALLGTALDISSSLVIATKSGGEIMLVFPGQRAATLETVEILIRELARFAAAEKTAK